MRRYKPEGKLISTAENRAALADIGSIMQAYTRKTPLEARVILCDNDHNLHLDLGPIRGIIPRNEGAIGIEDGSVRDIALISRVNKPVVFRITDFEDDGYGEKIAILSRRAVQQDCYNEYISKLLPGDVIDAKVTHIEGFGAFTDIGAGLIALIPIDAISVSRIPHPNVRFSTGDDIRAIVKDIAEDGKITLSHKSCWAHGNKTHRISEPVRQFRASYAPLKNTVFLSSLHQTLQGLPNRYLTFIPDSMQPFTSRALSPKG